MAVPGLSAPLAVLGTVATAAGAVGVVRGPAAVRGGVRAADPNVDSEFRFFAAWYVFAGVQMLAAAAAPERGRAVDAIAAGWATAAAGRLLSWRAAGRPDALYRRLTLVEAAIALSLVPWQRAAARAALSSTTKPS